MERRDQKHGCVGATLQGVKKDTQTVILEEEREFEAFKRGRGIRGTVYETYTHSLQRLILST